MPGREYPKLSMRDKITVCFAELVGTGILVFMGCLSCVSSLVPEAVSSVSISLSFGLAVMLIIQIFGHISGAHVNPAVTLAAVILGEMKNYYLAPAYIASQIVGAVIGFGFIAALTPSAYFHRIDPATNQTMVGFCSTVPHPAISSIQAICIEILITMILVLVCAGVWDVRNKAKKDSIPLRFGLAIAGLAMCAGSYTGASMNPARSFGPALINGDWQQHWVYWVGPLSAAVIGGGGYRAIFARPEKQEPQEDNARDANIPLTNQKRT